jgi:hypothetical protein
MERPWHKEKLMGSPAEPGMVSTARGDAPAVIAGHSGPYPTFHGRRVSWVAVSIIMVGFLVGGLALIFGTHGPTWWLFWTGAGLTVLGTLIAIATNTFEDWY